MSTQTILVPEYEIYPWNLKIQQSNARFLVIAGGRRLGKTHEAVRFAVSELAAYYNKTKKDDGWCWIVAPTFPLVDISWRIAKRLLKDVIRNIETAKMRLVFDFGTIEFKSADNKDEGLRGEGLVCAVMEEASRISLDAWQYGVRPALSDKQGRAMFISTPKGFNWFHDVYQMGQRGEFGYQSWQVPSNTRPSFPQEEWLEAKRSMPEKVFRQEMMAEFIQGAGAVFNLEYILTDGLLIKEAHPNEDYSIGVDLAERQDFFTIAVVSRETRQLVDLHRSNRTGWEFKRQLIGEISRQYNNSKVILDSTGVGDPIEYDLKSRGVYLEGYHFSQPKKQELIERMQVVFEQGLFRLPQETRTQWLIDELKSYEMTTDDKDNDRKPRYSAPQGKHDDGVIALGLALYGMRSDLYTKLPILSPAPTGMTLKQYIEINETYKRSLSTLSPLPRRAFTQFGEVFFGANRN